MNEISWKIKVPKSVDEAVDKAVKRSKLYDTKEEFILDIIIEKLTDLGISTVPKEELEE